MKYIKHEVRKYHKSPSHMNGWFNEKSDFVYIDTCSREEIKEHQNEREREREKGGINE